MASSSEKKDRVAENGRGGRPQGYIHHAVSSLGVGLLLALNLLGEQAKSSI